MPPFTQKHVKHELNLALNPDNKHLQPQQKGDDMINHSLPLGCSSRRRRGGGGGVAVAVAVAVVVSVVVMTLYAD